jgi:hypothetical protein
VLEHEITPDDVSAFLNMYPLIATAAGGEPWQAMSISQLFDGHANGTGTADGDGWYQNSDDNTASVTDADILVVSTTSTTSSGGGAMPTGNGTSSSAPGATPTTSRSGAIVGRRVTAGFGGVVMGAVLALAL